MRPRFTNCSNLGNVGFFLIFILFAGTGYSGLPTQLAESALPFHNACVERVPASRHSHLHAALVCGAKLPGGEQAETFRRTGLLHLIVVSGAHLLWLEALYSRLAGRGRLAKLLLIPLLCTFALAARLEPPLLRGGLSMACSALSKRYQFGWSPLQIAALSGLFSLALFPIWFGSLSLLLSWTASLALARCAGTGSSWKRQITVYLCMAVCLLPLLPPHPLSIVFNVLAGPVLALLLFPLSAAAWAIPALTPLVDPVFSAILVILTEAGNTVPLMPEIGFKPGLWVLWFYLFLLNTYWWREDVRRKRVA